MKSVLISIKPKWVAKILNGEKRVELRKTAPVNCDYPLDVYIYCTKNKKYANLINRGGFLTGMVVAKFKLYNCIGTIEPWDELLKFACISEQEFKRYGKGKPVYMWTIDDLEIFDKPKELSRLKPLCENCKYTCRPTCIKSLKAPQSWCYVEAL